MKSLHDQCTVRDDVFDSSLRSTVLDLTDLVEDQINARDFFSKNYVTVGMQTLLQRAFDRFSRRSDQGTFLLTQAMGGGKTHNMVSLGLLAKHPELRETVLPGYIDPNLGRVNVAAFTGRESDAPLGIWGAIAEQIGKKEQFSDYYSPLSAPGQTAWVELLKGEPLLILLDELPPYFANARAVEIGNADLATVTTTALSNLLVAVGRPELENVCVVISDLTATYDEGSQQIGQALHNLENEASRSARHLEPVQQNTSEIYHILRKQIFSALPDEDDIRDVAKAYAQAVQDAKQMDVTDASPAEYARRLQDAYPFHFSIRDLYARFRENPGFQQTRDLIRLMRTVVARMYTSGMAEERALVHPYDVDLNHKDTLTQVANINPKLENAISHDIASEGTSVAEQLDANRNASDAQDAATLLLMASLANVPKGVRGLTRSEVISLLSRPGRDVTRIEKEVLRPLYTSAWYLHTDTDGRLLFKNVENINARLKTASESYSRETRLAELRNVLYNLFEPSVGDVYQEIALAAVDNISISSDRVTLVIKEPEPGHGVGDELQAFYDDLDYKNRVLFLTGQRGTFRHLLEKVARLKGIRHILEEMDAEKVSKNDPQYTAAQDLRDEIRLQLLSAARETFTTLLFPSRRRLREATFMMHFEGNQYNGEEQIRNTLSSKSKFTTAVEDDVFRQKCEQRLFTQQSMPWTEIKKRAAAYPHWPWHRPDALDRLKDRMVRQDQWREEKGGYVNKGPFAPPETDVRIQEIDRNPDTGELTLRLTPVHGDTIYYEIGAKATEASSRVERPQTFKTDALNLFFLCVDSTGEHDTGDPVWWENKITIQHGTFTDANGHKRVRLKAVPKVPIRYTTDGSNPRDAGGHYDGPIPVRSDMQVVQAVAESNGVASAVETFRVEANDDEAVSIDPAAPVQWKRSHQCGTTRETYDFLDRMDRWQAAAQGPRITADADAWAELAFDRSLTVDGDTLRDAVEYVHSLIDDSAVTLHVDALHFHEGQDLHEWVADVKTELTPDEIDQP